MLFVFFVATLMLFVFFVATLWMRCERSKTMPKAAWVWLAVATIEGLPFMATAEALPFTNSRVAADWIRRHGLEHELWGAWPGRQGALISVELGRPSLNLEKDR